MSSGVEKRSLWCELLGHYYWYVLSVLLCFYILCVYYIPGLPLPVPCSVPDTPNGHHTFNGGEVPRGATIGHAEVVRLVCEAGHSIVGSDTLRCWYGQWTVTGARPSCTPGIYCTVLL